MLRMAVSRIPTITFVTGNAKKLEEVIAIKAEIVGQNCIICCISPTNLVKSPDDRKKTPIYVTQIK